MGRVFFDIRENIHNVSAAYDIIPSDSGKVFMIDATTGFNMNLPNASDAQQGWYCKFYIKTAASTNVTISATAGDGDNMLMQAHSLDGTDRQVTAADVLTFASAEKGDFAELICDGTSWYVNAWVADDGHVTLD
mgnify:CR=1 FL=1|tara:strand:- start:57 stop:458 length:402 start_codon:yes stop_codon:yes gene_type:complete